MNSCLVIDFGNVVGLFDHLKACRALAALSRASLTPDGVHAAVFKSGLEAAYDRGQLSTAEFLARLRELLTLSGPDEVLGRAWSDIFADNPSAYPALTQIKARGTRLVLASNTNELHYGRIADQFSDVLSLFDDRVLSFRQGVTKPARAFFEACLRSAGVPAERCVFVDDKAAYVAAATELGMTGRVYAGGDLGRLLAADFA